MSISKLVEQRKIKGYREIPHTADLSLEVWAPDFFGLLEQAALGMYALMGVENNKTKVKGMEISLTILGDDPESLLVAFLSEVLFCLEEQKKILYRFQFTQVEMELHVQAVRNPWEGKIREIKAVTYHNLGIRHERDQWRTRIVFDV